MCKRLALVVLIALLTACSSSGPLKIGPDTYTASATMLQVAGGVSAAKETAIKSGQRFCVKENKEFLLQSFQDDSAGGLGPATSTIIFRCLTTGDPELQRPNYQPAPSVVIEHK